MALTNFHYEIAFAPIKLHDSQRDFLTRWWTTHEVPKVVPVELG